MSSNIDKVREKLSNPEDIAPADPGAIGAPPPAPPDRPGPDNSGDNPFLRASQQPLNDYGNGQRFVIHFGEDVMFVPRVGWFTWTGRVWRKDVDQIAVRTKVQNIWRLIEQEVRFIEPSRKDRKFLAEEGRLRARLLELEEIPLSERADNHEDEVGTIRARLKSIEAMLKDHKSLVGRRLTHAKNAGNNAPMDNMLKESTTSLAVPFEDLDTGALDVNTLSGVMRFHIEDMRQDGAGKVAEMRLIPHERAQKITKMVPIEYDPKARAPLFEQFMARIQPDREMREFLKRWLGLSMTGQKFQGLTFFYGSGANGKSVLVDLMGRMMDGYAAIMKIESLTGTNRRTGAEATPDLIPLMGARFVRTSEPDQGERLQEALVKQLTGGEPIPVRPNYGEQIDLTPIFKLTMSGNHKPEIRGTDEGIWRRVMLVPFDVHIPANERDEALGDKLWAERVGILNWMVEGLVDYLEGGLSPPQAVLDATKEYREESDPIGTFLRTCCVISGEFSDTLLAKDFGDAFNYHLLERGHTSWKPTTFAKQISTLARSWRHPETGKQFTKGKASRSQYTGIRLTDAFDKRFRNAPRDHQGRPIGVNADAAPDPAEMF